LLGRPQEALASFEIADRLNPNASASRLEPIGWAYYLEQRYDEAITAFSTSIPADPNDYYIYAGLAASYAQVGRKDDAAQAVGDLGRTWPFFTIESFVTQFQRDADRSLIAEGLHKAGLK
jgi:adenylate cyclase